METFAENNIVYTEYLQFTNHEDMIRHVSELTMIYKNKKEQLFLQLDVNGLQVHIKILKHNMWIGVFSKN